MNGSKINKNEKVDFKKFLSSPFINDEGKPSIAVKKLFSLLGYSVSEYNNDYYQICQRHFLRKQGQYRWEIESTDLDQLRPLVQPLLAELGFVDAVFPICKEFGSIFIHGGIYFNLRTRCKFLDMLWSKGIKGDKIIIVASMRPLLEIEESHYVLDESLSSIPFRKEWIAPKVYPSSEMEMAQLIWDQIVTNDDLRNKKVQFLIVKDTLDPKTKNLRHANTEDTLNAWLQGEAYPGNILAISNNPYIQYQHAKLRNALLKFKLLEHCSFETVGEKVESDLPLKLYLDTLARWFDTDLHFRNEIHFFL